MYGKSPMMKKLIGGQKVLKTKAPELAAAIEDSPMDMSYASPAKKDRKSLMSELSSLEKTKKSNPDYDKNHVRMQDISYKLNKMDDANKKGKNS